MNIRIEAIEAAKRQEEAARTADQLDLLVSVAKVLGPVVSLQDLRERARFEGDTLVFEAEAEYRFSRLHDGGVLMRLWDDGSNWDEGPMWVYERVTSLAHLGVLLQRLKPAPDKEEEVA